MQYNLPIIITHILPGQEQLNLDYLLAKGLVEQVSDSVIEQIALADVRNNPCRQPNVQPIINPSTNVKTAV